MRKLRSILTLTALASACHLAAAQTTFAPTSTEYSWSTTVNQLGMRNIHNQGILGQGVVIGMIDTGLNTANPEFQNIGSRLLTGYNAVDGSNDVTDSIGHGTHTTGIAAAAGNGTGMYGVAPEASILMVKVFNGGTASASAINRGIDYASAHGARVINLSLGAPTATGDASLRAVAAGNNAVVVIAAGNDSAATPNWPGHYAKESWTNGTILVVGAVDANKRIASFSNKAGDTAQYFLVAPGVSIISSYNTGYAYLTGTSMAAPAVSGAAALITGYWPYLRANQVASILLNTADDLGAPGVDAVYGRGMLNVNRALSPIGSYTYRTANGSRTTVSLSTAGVTSTRPSVSTPSAFKGLVTQVFDEYGRNYTSDEGAALMGRSVMTLNSVLGRPDRMLDAADQVLSSGSRLTRLQSRQTDVQQASRVGALNTSGDPWNHLQRNDSSMVILHHISGLSFSAGDGGLSGMSLGLMSSSLAQRLSGADSVLGNPMLGFAPNHQFASVTMPLSAHWSGRLAAARSKAYDAASGDVNLLEFGYDNGTQALNISAGQLTEQGLLGGYTRTQLGLNQQTGTSGLTISGAWALGSNWTLTGSLSRTRTAAPTASGLLVDATDIKADGYGLGLVRADNWRADDRLSFTINAPLRARSGTLSYSVVNDVDQITGEPIYGVHTVNLAPTAREWTVETRYSTRLTASSSVSAVAAVRVHPDHDASAPSQLAAGIRFNQAF
ncbi:MAG TPA: S8 family serine peptidase [Aquabacterium sp.]|uniref:S8 family peptidase n=1 Tax=Aquabacterium sp. TaxID=1872578 RepID=UPI002E35595E|nr:S8 family serine peptidase [Aquabacterium sp.]HEX5356718.1 S8 family serine peptidase [Aquabacterium sp.]